MSVINYEPGERPYEKYAGYLDRQGTGCDSWDELTEDEKAAWAEVELPEPYKPDAAPPPAGDALAALAAAQARVAELEARLADGGAEHPSCDAHRWWAVVKHYGSFAYGFAATQDGLRTWSDADEFEYAKAQDFE